MCGRFVSTSTPEQLVERFAVDESRVADHAADYNVAPRRLIYAVRARIGDHGTRRYLDLLRWGLVPSWAKDVRIGDRMINARAETVGEKPAFRRAFAKRRCIIPADGFYEWQRREGRRKQPTYIRRVDGEPLAFAGLWEAWRDPEAADPGESAESDVPSDVLLRSCLIVTTDANELVAPIHDRMPVVLPEHAWEAWLDPDNHDTDALVRLLVPAPAEWFEAYPVSTRVNRPTNNDPDLLVRTTV